MRSILTPPNWQLMTDDVTGEVLQRSKYRNGDDCVTDDVQQASGACGQSSAAPQETQENEDSWRELAAAVAAVDAKNRERCRLNMVRYRRRQREKFLANEKHVRELKEEIRKLELQKRQVALGVSPGAVPWCAVAEYFRLFRFGYKAPEYEHQPHVQLDFLRVVLTPDIVDGPRRGLDALVKCWESIMQCCQDFEFHLKRLENGVDGAVTAFTTASYTISESTLRLVFPHLLANKETLLVAKLLGKRIHVRDEIAFYWDDDKNQIKMLVVKLDMVTALLDLLGNLRDVSRVLKETLVTL